jgi:hypothetical protein
LNRHRVLKIFLSALFITATFAPAIFAGALNPDVIALFPKNAGEFAYADLQQARQLSWFKQFQEQVLPPRFRQFEQFLTTAGVNPNSQVQSLAWALVPLTMTSENSATSMPSADQIIGIAQGQFDLAAAASYFKAQKLASFEVQGMKVYGFGSGAGPDDLCFMFIDAGTAAFGQRSLIERMINVRKGGEESLLRNATMADLIRQANGQGIFWGALNGAYTRLAIAQLVPQASQFPQAADLLTKVNALLITVQGSGTIEADFHAICATSQDATTISQLMQAGLMMERYQAGQSNPDLAHMLDSAKILPNSEKLDISFALTESQITALIRSNTFATKIN